MLISLRKGVSTWLARGLLVLLVISFAVWGIEDVFRGSRERVLAKVGDAEITAEAFAIAFEREVNRLREMLGPDFDSAKAWQFGLDRQVLSQMVSRLMLDQETAELGITVPEPYLVAEIRGQQAFQNERGEFDRARFEQILRANNLTEAEFLAQVASDLARRQLVGSLVAGLTPPSPLVARLHAYRHETRRAEAVRLPADAVQVPEPSAEELARFHEEHGQQFERPERRAVTFVTLRPEDVIEEVEISEEALRETYDERRESFHVSPSRDIQQILFDDERTARTAARALDEGADFAEVARQYGGIEPDALAVKGVTRAEMMPEVADQVFALREGKISEPIASSLGWLIVRVTRITSERERPFAEVRDELRRDIAEERALDLQYELAARIEDLRAGGATLEEVAEQLDLPLNTIEIDAEGRSAEDRPAVSLPADPRFLTTAFSSDVGLENDLVEGADGSFFVLRVDAITPAAVPPLAEVRAQVAQAWRAERRQELLRQRAEALAERLRQGATLGQIAEEIGSGVQSLGPLTRDATNAPLPAESVAALFAAPEGGVVVVPAAENAGLLIARITEVAPPAEDSEALAETGQAVRESLTEDLLQQYRVALESAYEIEINEDVLAELRSATF